MGQSTTSRRPLQIYMDVSLSLNSINYIFPNYVFEQNISFAIYKKIKVKDFIVVATLLNYLSYTFRFSFSSFSTPSLCLLLRE